MSVDAATGVYHCFGCGESGDIFRSSSKPRRLNFSEAVELLARRAGIQLRIDPDAQKRRGEREALIEAVGAAIEFYHERLRKADDAGAARSYLRGRGYETDVVERFQLGYSPDGFTALYDHLRNDRKVSDKIMEKAGLASRNQRGRMYDRFRGRVMFPIYDLRGDPVGFGARLLEGEGPKYLNSPETSIYRKSSLSVRAQLVEIRDGATGSGGGGRGLHRRHRRAPGRSAGGGDLRHGLRGRPSRPAPAVHRAGRAGLRRRRGRYRGGPAGLRTLGAR